MVYYIAADEAAVDVRCDYEHYRCFPSTDYAVHTLMHHLEDYGMERFEMGYASTIAVFLFILMFATNKLVGKLLSKLGK